MKNKLIVLALLLFMVVCMICFRDNSATKTLTCTATENKDGGKTVSDLKIKIKGDVVRDMTLTVNMELSEEQQSYKQAILNQILQKTNQVYETDNGIKAVFDMNSSYFNTLGISKDASYTELKQVLELQGYTCKE